MKPDLKREQEVLVQVEKGNLTDSDIQMLKKYYTSTWSDANFSS